MLYKEVNTIMTQYILVMERTIVSVRRFIQAQGQTKAAHANKHNKHKEKCAETEGTQEH